MKLLISQKERDKLDKICTQDKDFKAQSLNLQNGELIFKIKNSPDKRAQITIGAQMGLKMGF